MPGTWDVVPGLNSSFGEVGADVNVSLYADWIDAVTTGGRHGIPGQSRPPAQDQKWSSVAMDADGDFVDHLDQLRPGRRRQRPRGRRQRRKRRLRPRYNSDGTAVGGRVPGQYLTASNQQYSKVAMDAAGDFVDHLGKLPGPDGVQRNGANPADAADSFGIYGQRYVRTSLIGVPLYNGGPVIYGPNGEYLTEFAVNTTKDLDQLYPSIAMDDTGDFVVVWSGEVKDTSVTPNITQLDLFMQRFDQPSDTAGPRVTETLNVDSTGDVRVLENDVLTNSVDKFIVAFSEDVVHSNPATSDWGHSVLNLSNWSLAYNGVTISGGVSSVTYDLVQRTKRR